MKQLTSKPMLRSLLAITVIASFASLAGCSSTNASNDTTAKTKADIAAGSIGTIDQFSTMESVCGTKPVSVGVVDGYGTNSWSKLVKAEIESEAAKCPAITKVEYVAGAGNLQATTSAITSMAAKGIGIILVIPDAGPGDAHLPAIRTATKAGSIVVPFASGISGTPGTDYLDYVDWIPEHAGQVWAQWMVDQLGTQGGNIVYLGGPAGSEVSSGALKGIQSVLTKHPQVKLLNSTPVVTNWDPAQAQQAMTGLLAQFPKIDGIITDYGASADGVIRAYQSAGLPLVPIESLDENSLSCGFTALKAKNPGYELATINGRTWIGRVALRKAMAQFEGKSDAEPSLYNFDLFEDSTAHVAGTKLPSDTCLADVPPDAAPSSLLSSAELAKTFAN